MQSSIENAELVDRFTGCLLGGAVGDALGWPVEFLSMDEIRRKYGREGILDFVEASGGIGAITDDTQMTLFTAEGLILAKRRELETHVPPQWESAVHQAYLRWLSTQGVALPGMVDEGWLLSVSGLHHRRAPGSTFLSALESGRMGTVDRPINNSKGCGGVMRAAPVGLFCAAQWNAGNEAMGAKSAFDIGCAIAAITHGHPLGYLPAGFLAAVIFLVVSGRSVEDSIEGTLEILAGRPEQDKCRLAAEVQQAIRRKRNKKPCPETIERFGGGWVGDEALVISLYCALAAEGDFAKGVKLAVNHSGDSDSTGSITGNILGAQLGINAIPSRWLNTLEMRNVIEQVAVDTLKLYEDSGESRERYLSS